MIALLDLACVHEPTNASEPPPLRVSPVHMLQKHACTHAHMRTQIIAITATANFCCYCYCCSSSLLLLLPIRTLHQFVPWGFTLLSSHACTHT